MKNYIDANKLKAEIERQQRKLIVLFTSTKQVGIRRDCALQNGVYSSILDIINALLQEQPIQVNTLTWKDINDLERIINNVHYEFRNGIGEKSFGEEVLERFREERDEQEQPSIPDNLDEAAEKWKEEHFRREYYQTPKDAMSRSFKAGAEWGVEHLKR